MSKTVLAQEISRVQNLYDDLYGDDPEYGNGPAIRRDLQFARDAFEGGMGLVMDNAIDILKTWSISPNAEVG